MEASWFVGVTNWISLISVVALIFCFYFTLNFFEYLKSGEKREMNQAKMAAVISLAVGLLLPILTILINL